MMDWIDYQLYRFDEWERETATSGIGCLVAFILMIIVLGLSWWM